MEIFGIGLPELVLIAVVALVILGPERLPEAARTLGKGVADFRRAMEPARSAWKDLTSEITNVGTEVKGAVQSTTNSITSSIKPTRQGEAITAIPTENPWTVHPIMDGMTPEEKARFMQSGEIPPRIQEELARKQTGGNNGNGYLPEVIDLEYPMPHSVAAPAARRQPEIEVIEYPKPGNESTQNLSEEAKQNE